jgi:site-specific recombinase XerD
MKTDELTIEEAEKNSQLLIEEFENFLKSKNLSKKVIKNHIGNMDLFADYMANYDTSEDLSMADSLEIISFLGGWFPRKALWACPTSIKSYVATFRKFFKWMVENKNFSKEEYADIVETMKQEKESWIEQVSDDFDEIW